MPFDPKQLDLYPLDAGVYLMKNANGSVIYVGKAKSLQKRLKQYFAPQRDSRPTVPLLLAELQAIDTIIVPTEKEALLLENSLIKKHQPKFNILLKDDKNYISLSINPHAAWPRWALSRLKDKPSKGLIQFGPYTSTLAAKETFELMSRLFPLRQCSDEEFKRRTRPCLLYSMKKCLAPCMNFCSRQEYHTYVENAISFLQGNSESVLKHLTAEMYKASEALEFEKAGAFLRTIEQVKHVTQEKTIFEKTQEKNLDVLGLYREADKACISKLVFRSGDLVESQIFSFPQVLEENEELLSSFLLQHYLSSPSLPEEILLPFPLPHEKEILSLLRDVHPKAKRGSIISPKKGDRKDFIHLAEKNAKSAFQQKETSLKSKETLLQSLQELLHLSRYPQRIECFDTSHISGSHLVAACTVFMEGTEDKKKGRLYHVKSIDKADDYGALRQVLTRRVLRAKEEDDFPDLLIIDGGKGQLGIALDVLQELEVVHVDVIAIVKEMGRHDKGITQERVYLPRTENPISFPSHSPLLFFLQRIRDATHEKAISFYRKTHQKSRLQSALDDIPGIGPIKKKRLLQTFGSVHHLLSRSEEELRQVPGITSKDIDQIKKISEQQM